MWARATQWFNIVILLMPLLKAEDSLQSALNAVNRRQRDLSEHRFGEYDRDGFSRYGYSNNNDNDDVTFLNSDNYSNEGKENTDLEENLYDYLEEKGLVYRPNLNDPISSPFRERVEKDKASHRERVAEAILNKLYDQEEDGEDNDELMPRVYDKYRHSVPETYEDTNPYNKRYYNNLGWSSVGMKKRSRYFQPDGPSDSSIYLLNYAPRDEIFNRLEEEDDPNSDTNWSKYNRERKAYPYMKKRFPVTKRSSNYYPAPYENDVNRPHKRSPRKEMLKTDPKVEKDLSVIFDPKQKEKKTATPKKIIHEIIQHTQEEKKANKEELPSSMQVEKPIDVKKKSINWADYFGLDRRKKSDDDIDNEWLLERYHKAVSLASKRTDTEKYPLQNFQKHDQTKKENKNADSKSNEMKEMDEKLKNIEESMVDDVLKFTGAHEGTTDSKELQDVKDKIISQLAAAYRLEKMRRALNGYKQFLEMKSAQKNEDISNNKRVSVPRKQAVDEEREKTTEEDNNIKCTEGDENCNEQNYKTPKELLERTNFESNGCPKIERACYEVSSVIGPFGRVFEDACNFYQMCLICGDNSWFSPTRQCNVLYLSKADDLCDGDPECRRVARHSVKYLLRVNRSLRADPFSGCDVECPDKR